MPWIALITFAVTALAAQADRPVDAVDIVRRSSLLDAAEEEIRRNYTFRKRTIEKDSDKNGAIGKVEEKLHEVTFLYGEPYERLTAKDGKPLAEADEAREQKKMDREIERRAKRSPNQHRKIAEAREKDLAEARKFREEIVKAFRFQLAGEEDLGGRMAYKIQAEPLPGYRPGSRRSAILTKVRGVIWIDKELLRWVRMEVEFIDTWSMGWLLLRVSPGTRLSFQSVRLNGELWMPARVHLRGSGRVAAVKQYRVDHEVRFEDYRRFQTESRVISSGP